MRRRTCFTLPLLLAASRATAQDQSAWRQHAVAAAEPAGRPVLALVIDDMGVNLMQTARGLALPGPLTLSWLPYAAHVTEQAAEGTARGHETLLHMNMEALGHNDTGPEALRTWLPMEVNRARLRAALDLLPDAVGLNQHEGSVASLSAPMMDMVGAELAARGLLFLDSLTIPHGVGLERVRAAGVPAVARDVFLDNDPRQVAIEERMAEAESLARRVGHAVAIGHPRVATMDVLERVLPAMVARGVVLWPLSAVMLAAWRGRDV